MVFLHYLMAHARPVVHAVDVAFGDNLHQIEIPLIVLSQKNEVVIPLLLEPVVSFGNIYLTAYYGLYARVLLGKFEELLYAVHVAVVRDGKGRHAKFIGPVEEVFYGRLPVQDGVLGVDMKVHKTHRNKDNKKPRPLQGRGFYLEKKSYFSAFFLAAMVASYMMGVPIMMEA